MSDYEQLHRQCRTLENLFDTKLTSYSQLAASISRNNNDVEATGSAERWKDLETELDDLLEKACLLPRRLARRGLPQQFRDIERYSRTMHANFGGQSVKNALDQANLLSGVRNDIDAYKSSAADSLLAERSRIDSSHRMTDDVLEQAYETRSEFARQRTSLSGINTRMMGVLNTMPGINNVIGMIRSRRRRDSIILGTVIGVSIIIILTYMWN
ncbi:hypothetical protein D9615_001223 [Tricholomella constricta]|uniref:Protein transport protein BOS1 n=1 Tax=Tricholomella constricta TaxID=117010 RepID=A0A8H5HLA2_9AGAR|nr:hypothetical protein D9615_001223 [Tricholomella constricta]